MDVKYPDVVVRLSGEDGNAFSIIERVTRALGRAGVSPEELYQFREQATSGDYDNVLQTCMKWVDVR
jgi:hypothetical protein